MDGGTSKTTPSSAGKAKGRNGVVEKKEYPDPLTSHEEVVKDPIVFWDTLRVPVIGGKELDLHVLYVEATKRGGYEMVVAEKKWREVGSVFKFSPTTTSASFVLRKHYFSLLFHYEQVHFFKVKGPLITPAVASPLTDPSCRSELAILEYSPKPIREILDPLVEVTGTIEGKFDCGYLISVRLGSEVLTGVIYHPEQHPASECSNAIVPYKHIRSSCQSGRRRRRRAEDPSHPKPNRSGYNFFFAEKHYKLKSLYPNREREFTKMIGESWNSLSPEERMVYQNIGLKDKERYWRELKEYKEQLKQKQGVETEKTLLLNQKAV